MRLLDMAVVEPVAAMMVTQLLQDTRHPQQLPVFYSSKNVFRL
jgi:hypothetical protein